MSSILAMCIWALATMALAPLPLRHQKRFGLVSLLTLPVILIWLGRDYGAVPVLICSFAAMSLFRKPLAALYRAVKRQIAKR
ncbi:DUF2484 family protein [Celeribacter sp.]|uniref:DUF2484 family protein n=1 Tax=Celeribacter sp. TaxID=1890673 RepID=UPI003A924686